MKKVAVVGVGETKFSGPQDKTEVELFAEAAMEAINESNLKPKDIKALFVGNVLGDFAEGQGMVQAFAAENIGCLHVPANRYEGACASASMAVRDAFIWVASGFYDIVLAGGVERAATMGTALATRTFAMFSDARYEYPSGITFPAVFAMLAHLYSDTYGIPLEKLREQMAKVSIQSYKHGYSNPKAHFYGKYSDLTIRAREISSQQAYDMAGVTPQDIDLCELHDCFSIASLIATESLGFFEFGRAGEAWEKGEADIGGKIAINPSGGLKSKGHPIGATGAGQVYEVTKQLRGEVPWLT
jgi:acetyl-CoA acetyltransferase